MLCLVVTNDRYIGREDLSWWLRNSIFRQDNPLMSSNIGLSAIIYWTDISGIHLNYNLNYNLVVHQQAEPQT